MQGRIPDCADHDDRTWIAVANVTRAEVDQAVALGMCAWSGRDLIVHGYDLDGERSIRARRKAGKRGAEHGVKGGRPRKTPQHPQPKTPEGLGDVTPADPPSPTYLPDDRAERREARRIGRLASRVV